MVYSHPDSQRSERIIGDWTGTGHLEGGSKPSEPPAHISHHIPQYASLVLGGPWDRYRLPQGQAVPTAYRHEGGGSLQGFLGHPEGI